MIAYSHSVTALGNGVLIVLREKLKVAADPNAKKLGNIFAIVISEELAQTPREVIFTIASSNLIARVQEHMNSLTDELIFNQWFRVKEHRKGKKNEND